jgi:D-sedoheptulose 7-phosphate isomerase
LVGRFKKDRKALRSIALTTDTSVLTCVANDYSYKDVFSRQLEALARPGDVLVAISTSGQSENVLRAITTAKQLGVETIALLGKDGGEAKNLADLSLLVPSDSTARIQEAHILIGHILCDLIEEEMGLV